MIPQFLCTSPIAKFQGFQKKYKKRFVKTDPVGVKGPWKSTCSMAQFWHLQHFKWPKKFQTQQTFIYSIRKKKALQLTVDNQSRQSKLESLQWRMFQVASCWQPRMLQKATNSECKINDQDLGQCSLMVFTGKHKHRVLPSSQQLLHLKFGKVYNG